MLGKAFDALVAVASGVSAVVSLFRRPLKDRLADRRAEDLEAETKRQRALVDKELQRRKS